MRMRLLSLPAMCLVLIVSAGASVKHSSRLRKSAHSTVKHTSATESAMSSERATQIQTALIKQGYLTGEPTGVWDSGSIAAMQKLQGDNGWQTKMVPSARGLIKLGLGSEPASPEPAQATTH